MFALLGHVDRLHDFRVNRRAIRRVGGVKAQPSENASRPPTKCKAQFQRARALIVDLWRSSFETYLRTTTRRLACITLYKCD